MLNASLEPPTAGTTTTFNISGNGSTLNVGKYAGTSPVVINHTFSGTASGGSITSGFSQADLNLLGTSSSTYPLSGSFKSVTGTNAALTALSGSYTVSGNVSVRTAQNVILAPPSGQTTTLNVTSSPNIIRVDGAGTVQLLRNLLFESAASSNSYLTMVAGILDLNAFDVQVGKFNTSTGGTINLNGGNMLLLSADNSGTGGLATYSVSGTFTFSGTGKIKFQTTASSLVSITDTSSSASYANANFEFWSTNTLTSYKLTMPSGVTINNIRNMNSIVKAVELRPAGSLINVKNLELNNTTLTGGGSTQFNINYVGTSTVNLVNSVISYTNATPPNKFYALTSGSDGGNNSGWIFNAPPITQNSNFMIFFNGP